MCFGYPKFRIDLYSLSYTMKGSAVLRCGSFSKKISKKKHLCHHDKNYCYFSKSNISEINLIVGSRNMIKLYKNMSL